MNDNEQTDLDRLRAWRRGSTSRILVMTHDGSVRLIEFRDGARFDADFSDAGAAVQALAAGCVHWVQRSAPDPPTYPLRRRFHETPAPEPAKPEPRVLSQSPKAVYQRATRARRAAPTRSA